MKTVYEKPRSPGVTIIKILCATFLVSIVVVSQLGPALDSIDQWTDNLMHQIYILMALSAIGSVVFLYWWIKRQLQ